MPMRVALRRTGQVTALVFVAGLLALLIWRTAFAGDGGVAAELAQGRHPVAPAFTLPRLDDGSPLSLRSLRGQAVVVNFWASWCPPCKVEAPALQRLYERYRRQGLVVVGIDQEDFRADARRFVRRHGLTFPVVHDRDKSTVGRFGVTGYPETYFVDRSGRIVGDRITGPIDSEKNRRRVQDGIAAALARPAAG